MMSDVPVKIGEKPLLSINPPPAFKPKDTLNSTLYNDKGEAHVKQTLSCDKPATQTRFDREHNNW